MGENMTVNIGKIRKTGLVDLTGQMEEHTLANGKMTSITAKVHMLKPMENRKKEYGIWVKGRDGSMTIMILVR